MSKVYLSGSIKGMTHLACTAWRDYAIKKLAEFGIDGITPTRYKGDFQPDHVMSGPVEGGNPMMSQKGSVTRDRFDVTTCDVFLANLLGAERPSIGTLVEYGWADAERKPIITVMEERGNPHDHKFIRELSGYVVQTLDDGLLVARAILCK